MGQKKLQRFADIKTFSNVLEYPEGMQGKWNSFFKNDNPLVLELACGRGEYTVGLSALFADKNFIEKRYICDRKSSPVTWEETKNFHFKIFST
jgi:hypothetical protein